MAPNKVKKTACFSEHLRTAVVNLGIRFCSCNSILDICYIIYYRISIQHVKNNYACVFVYVNKMLANVWVCIVFFMAYLLFQLTFFSVYLVCVANILCMCMFIYMYNFALKKKKRKKTNCANLKCI